MRTEKKQRTHEKILDVAARLFRERGVEGASVDDVMANAGLTRGGFYAHFRDKSALLGAAIEVAFVEARRNLLGGDESRGAAWLERATGRYLNRRHLESPGFGCAIPALGGEVARSERSVRSSFTRNLSVLLGEMTERLDGSQSAARKRAIATMATWVGAMTMARAVNDPALADEILATCRREILE